MKIRIKGNSLRIRLTKPEVDLFATTGYIEEKTAFIGNCFIYAVKSCDEENLSAHFTNGKITLMVQAHLVQQWAATSLVALEHNMPLPNNQHLYLLLEKDFKCIDAGVTDDQSDYFENPLKAC